MVQSLSVPKLKQYKLVCNRKNNAYNCWKYSRLGAIAERGGESVIKTFHLRNMESIDIKHLYYCIYDNLKDKTFITI